jgi:hypothetical protein
VLKQDGVVSWVLKASRRAGIVFAAVNGTLDPTLDVAALLSESQAKSAKLHGLVMKLQAERDYWFQAFRLNGTEHEAAQSMMAEEIDNLRQKLGVQGPDWLDQIRAARERREKRIEIDEPKAVDV